METITQQSVIAVQVRSVDPPQFLAEDMDDLIERFGASGGEWSGEQCDSCGCCAYTVEPTPEGNRPKHGLASWRVRCSGDAALAEEYRSSGADDAQVVAVRNGCGAIYGLRLLNEDKVAF